MLVFGDPQGDRAVFELRAPSTEVGNEATLMLGDLTMVVDGVRRDLRDQNGIETEKLASLRTDLQSLLAERSGGLLFCDHDGSQQIQLWVEADHLLVFLTVPGSAPWDPPMPEMLWDQPLPSMSWAQLPAMIDEVDRVEAGLGPLIGVCCGGTGPTWPGYDPRR